MSVTRVVLVCATVVAGVLPGATTTSAQQGSGSGQGRAAVPPGVTRADLALAYLRMDQAYVTTTMTDSVRATVNRAFDRSTMSFLSGRLPAALATIDSAVVLLTSALVALPASPERMVNGLRPSIVRDEFLARLAKIDSTGPLAQAHLSARARAALLVDVPSPERPSEFLANPALLARDLAREVGVLERGRNPYIGQAGNLWRVFRGANGAVVPFRVVAPSAAATSSKPVALLIALHGAGGDENMFAAAYGQGIIARMATEAQVIMVSPAAAGFLANPAHMDSLLAVLRGSYRIDDTRIYLLGHSMGAAAVARLVQQRPTTFAAAACLAGGSAVTVRDAPPMLFIGAALDPIIPSRLVKAAAAATPTGTYLELEHEGHTLMVANGVRQALPWLFAKHR